MFFQVFNSAGNCVLHTEYESCIPYDSLDDMSKAGYKFKVDGKKVSKEHVLKTFKRCENSILKQNSNESNLIYSKQVRCVNTGKIYKNQSAAAKDLNIDPAQVSDSIKTGRPRSGYTFERVLQSEVV